MAESRRRRALRTLTGLLVPAITIIGTLLGLAGSAAAHTGFESSTPAAGDIVAEPVTEVTIVFTGLATPVGEEFVALDPTGVIRAPDTVATDDDMTFRLEFDPPLTGGAIGIRWEVQAPDAHPIVGAFSFTVTAATPTTVPTTTVAPTTPGASTTARESTTTTTTSTVPATSLEDFLEVDDSRRGDTTQLLGRIVTLVGSMLTIGGVVFLASTFRGSVAELDRAILLLRVLGVLVTVGALVEYLGYVRGSDDSFASAWTSSPGLAMALRMVGGLLVAVGLRVGEPERSGRWDPTSSRLALGGAAVILVSFWFDGHTVSKGIRPVHAVVNTIHVGSGAVWAGGIVAMASTMWWRSCRGVPTRAAELVVRFSHIATAALVGVFAAGVLMAITVLDSVGELTSTEWGQILLLKMAAVALASCFGAYNHFRLRPALAAAPDDPDLAARLRSILTAEAIVLTFVVIVTAWLVAAAS